MTPRQALAPVRLQVLAQRVEDADRLADRARTDLGRAMAKAQKGGASVRAIASASGVPPTTVMRLLDRVRRVTS